MNETMSLVLATAILAVGGLGLYMYKNTTSDEKVEYNEDNLFGFGNLFGGKKEKKTRKGKKKNVEEEEDYENVDIDHDYDDDVSSDYDEDDIEIEEDIDFKPKSRASTTKKSRKPAGGGSKRRY